MKKLPFETEWLDKMKNGEVMSYSDFMKKYHSNKEIVFKNGSKIKFKSVSNPEDIGRGNSTFLFENYN